MSIYNYALQPYAWGGDIKDYFVAKTDISLGLGVYYLTNGIIYHTWSDVLTHNETPVPGLQHFLNDST